MIIFSYSLSIVLMLCLPIVLAVLLRRRFRVPWILFTVGSLTFIGSQVVHIPLNNWLSDIGLLPKMGSLAGPSLWRTALILGMTAGVSEELSRSVGYALLRRFRRFQDGLMMGLGHGGIEAMVFGGVLTAATISSLLPLRGTDLQELNLSIEQLAALSRQIELFTQSPWFAFYPLLERLVAMGAHVVISMLVLLSFNRRNALFFFVAVGYHALIDAAAVYVPQKIDNSWVTIGVFLAFVLPGLFWVWISWPRGDASQPRWLSSWSTEWAAFITATRKELLQQWRTKRLLVVVAVFVLFGLMSPLVAKFTPELLRAIEGAEQFADLIPEPTTADATAQYIKNLTQFGFILAILLGMGVIAGEKEKGTAAMILSKPMPRWAFVVSKFTAQVVVYVLAFGIAALGAYFYTSILFGQIDFGNFAVINLLLLLWLSTFVAVALMGSALGGSVGAAAGIGLGGSVLLLLAGNLPMGMLAPSGLVGWASQLGMDATGEVAAVNGGAATMSLVIILMCLITAVAVFEVQEL